MKQAVKYFSWVLCLAVILALFISVQGIDRNPKIFDELEHQSKSLIDESTARLADKKQPGQLLSAWSRHTITPPANTATLGYGDRKAQSPDIFDGDLFANAFAFQIENHRPVVMLTVDLCFWPN